MVKIFIYGTLKKGFGLNYLFSNSQFIGKAVLEGYEMYSLICFPFITKGMGKVFGEVYEIKEDLLKRLDKVEIGFTREKVEVDVLGKKIEVYTYVKETNIKGRLYFVLNKINSGVWK